MNKTTKMCNIIIEGGIRIVQKTTKKNLITIKDVNSKTPRQLKNYFKRDRKNNFICMRGLEDSARKFLKTKVVRYQNSLSLSTLSALFFALITLIVGIAKLELGFSIKAAFISWVVGFLITVALLIKANREYLELELLIEEYELTYLK